MDPYAPFYDYVTYRYCDLKPGWALENHPSSVNLKLAIELNAPTRLIKPWDISDKLRNLSANKSTDLVAFYDLWVNVQHDLTTTEQEVLWMLPLRLQADIQQLLPVDQTILIQSINKDALTYDEIASAIESKVEDTYAQGKYKDALECMEDQLNNVCALVSKNKYDTDVADRYYDLRRRLWNLKGQLTEYEKHYTNQPPQMVLT